MNIKRLSKSGCTVVSVIAVLLFSSSVLIANRSGPPDGRTGAPGESNCTVGCHSSFALNSGSGSLEISGIPAEGYTPDQTYPITITLNHSGASVWGFEAAVKDASFNQAGAIVVTEAPRTQTSVFSGITYIKHSFTGTLSNTWTFDWQAPASDAGPVTIYAAGNAANGNGSNQGDFIYTKSLTRNTLVTGVEVQDTSPGTFKLHGNYPNPFNPATAIRFDLDRPGYVELKIFDVNGREVRTLINESLPRGSHSVTWDSGDNSGTPIPSEIYFTRLKTGNNTDLIRMALIK
ncbi:choice-of-anchor V domain-containing protein [candidate division KSB1 bacterium]